MQYAWALYPVIFGNDDFEEKRISKMTQKKIITPITLKKITHKIMKSYFHTISK